MQYLGDRLVKLIIFFVGYFLGRTLPNRLRLIDQLPVPHSLLNRLGLRFFFFGFFFNLKANVSIFNTLTKI